MSDDNIKLAIQNSSKGKRKQKRVAKIYNNQDKYIPIIRNYAEHYKNKKHTPKIIYDGIKRKKRKIIVPDYMELIIQHMLVQTLMPMFMTGLYEHAYASIPNRGCYLGMKRMKKWLKYGGRNVKHCFKADIRKYFDSIPHDILLDKLRRKIKDKKIMRILEEIISVTKKGIPLGFYLSQWLANWYLMDFDHFVKEELKAVYYERYMDDIVITGSNKKKLKIMKEKIAEYLEKDLGLKLKDDWKIFRIDKAPANKEERVKNKFIDFMGYKFYKNNVTLRKSILQSARRKALKIGKKDKPTIYDCKQMLSYLGWIDSSSTYRYYENNIKPTVNFGYLKKRISNYDRKQSMLMKGELLLCG